MSGILASKTPPEITFHCFFPNPTVIQRTHPANHVHEDGGLQNAHDLITVSTDGRLCSWSVDNLQQPIESIQLMCKSKRQITALSMSFFHSNINSFVIGSEEKALYVGDRHGNKGEMTRSIDAHDMPVTAVDLHHAPGSVDFSPLCLSGSLDFNVKLWHLKVDSSTNNLQPLLSFERKHKLYIVDIQWSPVHPAVFVSASTDGVLNLWNLNTNTEQPIATITVSNSITKLLWSKNGQQLSVADNNGRVFLYDVHESCIMCAQMSGTTLLTPYQS
uniref:Uncharacterized protein n=1 Tax=Ditylenchus dipsaci TaxID=166011 RepID=A0A915DXU3_9BILA